MRSTTTDGNGTFSVPGLSPGDARFGDARMSGRSAKTATKNLLAGLANLRFVWRRARR